MGRWLAWTNGWGRAAVRKEGEAAATLGYCLPFIISIFLSWRGFSQSCWYPSLKLKPWARDCKKALEKSFFSPQWGPWIWCSMMLGNCDPRNLRSTLWRTPLAFPAILKMSSSFLCGFSWLAWVSSHWLRRSISSSMGHLFLCQSKQFLLRRCQVV